MPPPRHATRGPRPATEEGEAADPPIAPAGDNGGCPSQEPWRPLLNLLKPHGETLGEHESAAWLEAIWPELEAAVEVESAETDTDKQRNGRKKRILHARWRTYLRGDRPYRDAIPEAERARLRAIADEANAQPAGRYEGPLRSGRGSWP